VTISFLYDFGGIGNNVALDYRYFMVSGSFLDILFFVVLWGLQSEKYWALALVAGLAVFDIIGEFVAQGNVFFYRITVSFVVAIILLILSIRVRSQTV